jgi:LysM repeat protein
MPKDLVVPKNPEARETLASLPLMYGPPIPQHGPARTVHVVKRGDTLSSIARRYRVSVPSLKSWNQVGQYLQVGQKIYIR